MSDIPELRPERNRVRLPCWLALGDGEQTAHTVNFSKQGLQVQFHPDADQRRSIAEGARVALRLKLPDVALPLAMQAQVMWVDTGDRDLDGRIATSLGLFLTWMEPAAADQFQAFLRAFRYSVLIVDGSEQNRERLKEILGDEYRLFACATVDEALAILRSTEVAVLITDQRLPDATGLELLQRVNELYPGAHLLRIVIADSLEVTELADFINLGKILYYVRKPGRPEEWRIFPRFLLHSVHSAIDAYLLAVENERLEVELGRANQRLRRENSFLRERVEGFRGFEGIVGESAALRQMLAEVQRIRKTDVPVHLQGETGTGKELVARSLHFGGPRAAGPFVVQNCAGLTESLLQSTLFGHRKGAFTGADRDRRGVFQEADGGTLFLDEVADLSPAVQSSLLRALQEGEVVPVGASRPEKVDVRVVSATHKELRAEVARGAFREDVYFRLVVVQVRLPPLRERLGDVVLLVHHFVDLYSERFGKNILGFTQDAMRTLERYAWPGNVRELENEVQRLVILGEEKDLIGTELLSPHIRGGSREAAAGGPKGYDDAIRAFERQLVEDALESAGGNVSRAAEALSMERSRLAKLRKRLGLGR
ncbi:MAG TPA: sigma 54-interacting transcriptional regulator [Myxococcales bacterium]|nr:sigma 54-interacting transcriptional regulator [Myxococcales bacterium]